jgi:hypothetical protein
MRPWKRVLLSAITGLGLVLAGMGAMAAFGVANRPAAPPDCGAPSVDTIPCIDVVSKDASVPLNGDTVIGATTVRAGRWLFIARVDVSSSTGSPHTVTCTLTAGDGTDTGYAVLPPGQKSSTTMMLGQTIIGKKGTVTVSCNGVSPLTASNLKITAIRAGTLFVHSIS